MAFVDSQVTARYSALEAWIYDRYIAPAVEDLARELMDQIVTDDGSREVLDVGCGGGQHARLLATRRGDVRVTGLDLSDEQIERARSRSAAFGDRLRFVTGSALELPFADCSFDAVYSVASIKHWPDRQRGLAECVRVLRPGGQLVIVEADRGCKLDDARAFVGRWRLAAPLRRLALPLFRTWVAGQSVDLEEMRELTGALPLEGLVVRRVAGTPGLIAMGRRTRATA